MDYWIKTHSLEVDEVEILFHIREFPCCPVGWLDLEELINSVRSTFHSQSEKASSVFVKNY